MGSCGARPAGPPVLQSSDMSSRPPFRRTHGRGPWARLAAAFLLVLAIGADLAADSRCHPLALAQGTSEARLSVAQPTADEDACQASGCVPDCFCCSALSVSSPAWPLEAVAPAGCVASAPERDCPLGVHPAPYHPPIHLS